MKKFKKVIVTAGPTWVSLDKVRIISNIFSGKLGVLIAEEMVKKNKKVTLFLGPGLTLLPQKLHKNLKIVRFKFFDELFELLKKEVLSKKYDVLIHSAAVSDFQPKKIYHGKKSSRIKNG